MAGATAEGALSKRLPDQQQDPLVRAHSWLKWLACGRGPPSHALLLAVVAELHRVVFADRSARWLL